MQELTPQSGFTVTESSTVNLVVGILFSLLFLYSLLDKVVSLTMSGFVLIPAVYFLSKAKKSYKAIITINSKGFFYFSEHITDWDHFLNAYIDQQEIPGSIQDNFVLFIEYTLNGKTYRSKFALTNTQDKSEEEIIAAIKYYLAIHRSRKNVPSSVLPQNESSGPQNALIS